MEHNAAHDPIVQAGVMRCRKCGRVAFPTDAGRLDAGRIIAAYPSPCSHVRAQAFVIEADDVAAAADPGLSVYVPGRRCSGRNRFGRPCRAYAEPGSGFCQAHGAAQTTRDPS